MLGIISMLKKLSMITCLIILQESPAAVDRSVQILETKVPTLPSKEQCLQEGLQEPAEGQTTYSNSYNDYNTAKSK